MICPNCNNECDDNLMFCFFNDDDLNEAKEILSKLCILFVKSKHEKYYYEGNF